MSVIVTVQLLQRKEVPFQHKDHMGVTRNIWMDGHWETEVVVFAVEIIKVVSPQIFHVPRIDLCIEHCCQQPHPLTCESSHPILGLCFMDLKDPNGDGNSPIHANWVISLRKALEANHLNTEVSSWVSEAIPDEWLEQDTPNRQMGLRVLLTQLLGISTRPVVGPGSRGFIQWSGCSL